MNNKTKTKLAILILGGSLPCACGGTLQVNKVEGYHRGYLILNVFEEKSADSTDSWVLYDEKEEEVLFPGTMEIDTDADFLDIAIEKHKQHKSRKLWKMNKKKKEKVKRAIDKMTENCITLEKLEEALKQANCNMWRR